MVAKLAKLLGSGLYTVHEAAFYARVSPRMLLRWLYGTKSGKSVIDPQFGSDERNVSFLDLIQALAIREIRNQYKVPLPKFRQAIAVAKRNLGIDYPFARQHCTYLVGELGDEIIIKMPGSDDDEYVQASGKNRGHRLFKFVEIYLQSLSFGSDGLANRFQIFRSDTNVQIVMDPSRRFGEPLLPSGYTPMTIWKSIRAEGSIERVVKAYGIPREEVEASYKFFDYLGKTAA